ncbi:hypothetical protein AMTR_s00137p00112480 [Amborella trichopoda]|uniref:Uncharacterized protein n=1 Tax=Amborella trichopoda TaxID=13333 RepID=W1NFJ4_AMBTC|nr:hypothetical protein AMTR_s00137p00112480 [Amborella trichopoda]
MSGIEVDTANGLPPEEYKVWYNRVSYPIIHNVMNPPKDILQPANQEEEEFVLVDMDDIETQMENLQCEVNGEAAHDELRQDVVGESRWAAEDLVPSTQLAVEESKRCTTQKK